MHSPRTQKLSSTRAFTIVEVAMAMVVTLVAVVGLIQAVTIGSEMLDLSHKQTIAMQLIRNEIDNVRLQNWATVSALANATMKVADDGSGIQSGTPSANAARATFALTNYTTTTTDDNTSLMALAKGFTLSFTTATVKANLLQLTYQVTWTAGNRQKTYSRSGVTYYGKNGLNIYYSR